MQNKSTEKFSACILMLFCHYESTHLIRWWLSGFYVLFHISKDFPWHLAVDRDNISSAFFKERLKSSSNLLRTLRSVGTRMKVKI